MTFLKTDREILLASESKSRRTMFKAAGLAVRAEKPRVDEDAIKQALLEEGASPENIAFTLAEYKAKSISRHEPDALVVAADQVLICDEYLLSKAPDRQAAFDTLRFLSGRSHELISAAVVVEGDKILWKERKKAQLSVRDLSDAFINQYLDMLGEDAFWSVGCYQLEGLGAQLFHDVKGDYYTILGFPLLGLLKFLRERGDLAK